MYRTLQKYLPVTWRAGIIYLSLSNFCWTHKGVTYVWHYETSFPVVAVVKRRTNDSGRLPLMHREWTSDEAWEKASNITSCWSTLICCHWYIGPVSRTASYNQDVVIVTYFYLKLTCAISTLKITSMHLTTFPSTIGSSRTVSRTMYYRTSGHIPSASSLRRLSSLKRF